MKICWDTLEQLVYKPKHKYWVGGTRKTVRYVYADHCLNCGEPYLTQKSKPGNFCSIECGMLYSKGHQIQRPPSAAPTQPDPVGQRRNNIKKREAWISKLSQIRELVCERCGESAFECLDFHHRNPEDKDKSFAISRLFSYAPTLERVAKVSKELSKCDVLCANCHRKEHRKIFLSRCIQ